MKKYLITSAIGWTIYLILCITCCIVFWTKTNGEILAFMMPSFGIFIYNVYLDIEFFRKYGWTI